MRHDEKDYEALLKKYKDYFKHLSFGIECGYGWYRIIESLSEIIMAIIEREKLEDCYPDQIKEKFGQLRYYMSYENDDISKLIREAQELSEKTCESCGKPGEMQTNRAWLKVRCKECK